MKEATASFCNLPCTQGGGYCGGISQVGVFKTSFCSGYFCNLTADEIVIRMTHNSLAFPGMVEHPNQLYDLSKQFNDGIRGFHLALFQDGDDGEIYTCDPFNSSIRSNPYDEISGSIDQIKWQSMDFVLIELEDHIGNETEVQNFTSWFGGLLITNFDITLPLGNYIANDTRVLLVTDNDVHVNESVGIHSIEEIIVENEFHWTNCDIGNMPTTYRRGPEVGRRMALMNHFCSPTGKGNMTASASVDQVVRFIEDVNAFKAELDYGRGQTPNVLKVDYYQQGDAAEVEAVLRKSNAYYLTDYIGCLYSNGDLPIDAGTGFSVKGCVDYCRTFGYSFAGVQVGYQCSCGDTIGVQGQAPFSDCYYPCIEGGRGNCGAGSRNSVYATRYIGCYKDSRTRDLPTLAGKFGISDCLKKCGQLGYAYAGLQLYDQCWCGDSYGKYGMENENLCNLTCTQGGAFCGGRFANSVFQVENSPNPSPSQEQAVCNIPGAPDKSLACKEDVKTIEIIGRSRLQGLPISIVDQSSTTVTFKVQRQWNSTGQVYVQYFDPVVRQYTCVNVCNKEISTFNIVAQCMRRLPISIVEVWVETDDYNDNAVISSCCFAATGSQSPVGNNFFLESTFELRCVSLCES